MALHSLHYHSLLPSFSSVPQGFLLAAHSSFVPSAQTLIHSSQCPPSFANHTLSSPTDDPALPACLPAPKPAEVDTCTSFSNLSFANFLTRAPASSWAQRACRTNPRRGQPTVAAMCFPPLQLGAHPQTSAFNCPAFSGCHVVAHSTQPPGHPSPHRGRWPAWGFSHRCLFPKTHFFHWLPLLVCKPVPHVESKDRLKEEAGHSRSACGRFNKELTYQAVLGSSKLSKSPHRSARI